MFTGMRNLRLVVNTSLLMTLKRIFMPPLRKFEKEHQNEIKT